jgi:hypothetical protein
MRAGRGQGRWSKRERLFALDPATSLPTGVLTFGSGWVRVGLLVFEHHRGG